MALEYPGTVPFVESEFTLERNGHLMTASRLVRFHFVLVLSALAASAPALTAQNCPNAERLTRGLTGAIATVRYLADDALQGRLAGSPGERCAGDYIAARFRALGLTPGGTNRTFFQHLPVVSAINPHAQSNGRNVIALLPGSNSKVSDEWIIIGAHYDHLGHGEYGSAQPNHGNAIHNGADDNASGVAVMLEIARRLVSQRPARSVAFVAFTGEEAGLLGSKYLLDNPTFPLARAKAMINLDMVGRLNTGALIVYGIGTATEWDRVVRAAAAAEQLAFTANPEGFGPSDHASFYMKDIPVLHFFTNAHSEYHRPADDWELIDRHGLDRVAGVVHRVVLQIAAAGPAITLVRGAGRPPAATGENRGSGTYLGTIPDFSPVARGVKLAGVTAGSPGDQAGLAAGDVIVRFDDEEIADLQGMTDAMNKRKPGDAVRITVMRAGKNVELRAVFGRRSR
jgi:hypothetical protein